MLRLRAAPGVRTLAAPPTVRGSRHLRGVLGRSVHPASLHHSVRTLPDAGLDPASKATQGAALGNGGRTALHVTHPVYADLVGLAWTETRRASPDSPSRPAMSS